VSIVYSTLQYRGDRFGCATWTSVFAARYDITGGGGTVAQLLGKPDDEVGRCE